MDTLYSPTTEQVMAGLLLVIATGEPNFAPSAAWFMNNDKLTYNSHEFWNDSPQPVNYKTEVRRCAMFRLNRMIELTQGGNDGPSYDPSSDG